MINLALKKERIEALSQYAWNWFSYHAAQRMSVFRFFFLIMGVLAVGYYQSINSQPAIALGFSILASVFSILFWRLDLRTRELIKIGEQLLLEIENVYASWGVPNVSLVGQANTKNSDYATSFYPQAFYSYGKVFSCIFSIVLMASAVGAFGAAWNLGGGQILLRLCTE